MISEDFKRLVDRSLDAIYHYDIPSRGFLFYNKLFFELFGIEDKEGKLLSPKSVLMRIHPDEREKVKKAVKDNLNSGRNSGEVEYRLLHPDGSVSWMHDRWILIRDGSGRPLAIEGFIRDSTEHRQIEQELEQSRRNALVGRYIVQDGKFRYVNPEFIRISGYTENELLGMRSLTLVHEEYRSLVWKSAIQMLKGMRNSPYEFCIITKSSQVKWIIETVSPIRYEGHRAALGYFMDITQNKQAENERRERERLQGVLEMAGAVCHELNNPMAGIVLHCDALMKDISASDKNYEKLKMLKEYIFKISEITNNLVNITKYRTKDYVRGEKIIDLQEASRKEPHR